MLQFFATNRAMGALGRATGNRDERLKLSKGGYYFADMAKYMSFYMATTDADEMPEEAVCRQSDDEVFKDFLDDKRIGRYVVCVHGFNVALYEAFTWFRILTDTMKHLPDRGENIVTCKADLDARNGAKPGSLTAFIGFSWPSNGNVLSYPSDQREAIGSKGAFAGLLARLKAKQRSLNLICHSMGNYLACHTLDALVNEEITPTDDTGKKTLTEFLARADKIDKSEEVNRKDFFIDCMVMIAPDVERRHVTRCGSSVTETNYVGPFYSGLQHLAGKKVNIYSRFDSALGVSNIEKLPREAGLAIGDAISKLSFGLADFLKRNPDQMWEKRLGEAPAPVNAAPGFVSINATELAGRKIDHSDHIDALPIAQVIAEQLDI